MVKLAKCFVLCEGSMYVRVACGTRFIARHTLDCRQDTHPSVAVSLLTAWPVLCLPWLSGQYSPLGAWCVYLCVDGCLCALTARTMQALDGKIVEAEDQAAEADEKSLSTKSEWENKDLDWKGRQKEWTQKLKKESRNLTALEEARAVIKVV
jgi:hypothetical protein